MLIMPDIELLCDTFSASDEMQWIHWSLSLFFTKTQKFKIDGFAIMVLM